MRTNIDIDDALMAAAMEAGGFKTKKEAVEEGLRLLRRRKVYEGLLALRGQLQWDDSDTAWAAARVGQGAASLQLAEPRSADAAMAGKHAAKTSSLYAQTSSARRRRSK